MQLRRLCCKALKQRCCTAPRDMRDAPNAAIDPSCERFSSFGLGALPQTRPLDHLRMNRFDQVCQPDGGVGGQLCRASDIS